MAKNRVWHSGPPPHIGWWNAATGTHSLVNHCWRWWDGKQWSRSALANETALSAAESARYRIPRPLQKAVRWTDYWPENARVPRIDPRQPAATSGIPG